MNDKATIYDIAKALNLATSTVSRALNNSPRIAKSTRDLVNKTATGLNYRRNHIAAALRNGKSKLLGVIVPRIDRSFFSEAVDGIEQVANRAGYFVTICQSHESYENEVASVEALLDASVDGVLISCSKETTSFQHLQKIIARKIPLIVFDRVIEDMNVNMVSIDDFGGAYEATKHLIQKGYKRIAHLTFAAPISIYKNRLYGYQQALTDFGLPTDRSLVISNDLQLADGVDAMQQLMRLANPPDAVFSPARSRQQGRSIYQAMQADIPRQFRIVGFSDESFTSLTDPPLSIIDQHSFRIGNVAAELFPETGCRRLFATATADYRIRPTLVIRESTGR